MIHCPNCEVPLSTADLRAGNCPVCHTMVTPAMDTIPASPANRHAASLANSQTFPTNDEYSVITDEHATLPVTHGPSTRGTPDAPLPRQRRKFAILAVGAVALLIALVAILLLGHALPSPNRNPVAQSHTTTVAPIVAGTNTPAAHGGGATSPTPLTSSTPVVGTPVVTNSPATATTPAAPPTPLPSATAMPAGQANLAVSPLTFSLLACVNAQATFTITNTGTATLRWSATTSYTLSQPSGTLAAGAHSDIKASGIYKSGNITVTAIDLAGDPLPSSPQTVTVSCTV